MLENPIYKAIVIICLYISTLFVMTTNQIFGPTISDNFLLSVLPTLALIYIFSSENKTDGGKKQAQHPPVTKNLRHKKPTPDIIPLGKVGQEYVGFRLDAPGNHNVIAQGSSGVGKGAGFIFPILLNNKSDVILERGNQQEKVHFLILDPKGEFAEGTRVPGDGSIVINPADRQSFGFDPLYGLTRSSMEQEIKIRMELIANSIVAEGKPDEIWWKTGRHMTTAMLIYFFKYPRLDEFGNIPTKVTVPQLLKMSIARDVKETVKEIYANSPEDSMMHSLVADYVGLADQTLTSVSFNVGAAIKNFLGDRDICYSLSDNPRKINPTDLRKRSVYVVIPLDKLATYAAYWTMISDITMNWIMGLPEKSLEPDRPYFGLLFDELSAVFSGTHSKPSMLIQTLRLVRSRGGVVICASQTLAGIEDVMQSHLLDDFVANFEYKVVLDAQDKKGAEFFSKKVRTFSKRKVSYSGSSTKRRKSVSWQDGKIYDESDLATLGGTDELLLISSKCIDDKGKENPGFATLKKVFYFKDPYYKKLYDIVKEKQREGMQ